MANKVKWLLVLGALAGIAVALRSMLGRRGPEPFESELSSDIWLPLTDKGAAPTATTAPTEPWVLPTNKGACPDGYPVKAKTSTKVFHVESGSLYERTTPDRCYTSPDAAERDGFRRSKR